MLCRLSSSVIKYVPCFTRILLQDGVAQLSCPTYLQRAFLRTDPRQSSTTSQFGSEGTLIGTVVEDHKVTDCNITNDVIGSVNEQIRNVSHGRLFAVIYIHGKQFKVTPEDIIVIQANMPVDIGDSLRMEKVLLVGSKDFTLLGRPVLSKELVRVEATVIEKTLSHEVRNFLFKQRSRFQRSHFFRFPYTMLRINSVEFLHPLNEGPTVEGLQDRLLY